MARPLLIVNPYASAVSEDAVADVMRVLGRVDVLHTEAPGHATELVRGAAGRSAIYVFSGDGGFNEVLNGIDGQTPIGFIPGGGTNVLPRALGLPRDPVAAAQQVVKGRTRRIALGRANGRRFGFSAGLGLDAELIRRVDALGRSAEGKRAGDVAFVRAALKAVGRRAGRFEPAMELRGHGRAAFALVANCNPYSYAGGIRCASRPWRGSRAASTWLRRGA